MSDEDSESEVEHSPPPDMELATECKRILYCLNKTLFRFKYIGVLDVLIQADTTQLLDIFDNDELFFLTQTCNKYAYRLEDTLSNTISGHSLGSNRTRFSQKLAKSVHSIKVMDDDVTSSGTTITDDFESVVSLKKDLQSIDRADNDLSRLIFMLEENPKVADLIEVYEDEMSPALKIFMNCFLQVITTIQQHLGETAAEAKLRENRLREYYARNEVAKIEIKQLEDELAAPKTDKDVCIVGKNILINRHHNKISSLKKQSQDVIERRVKDSENTMVMDYRASVKKQEGLKQEADTATVKYNNLLKDDLAAEKVLRVKRSKVENQLVAWLQKYDQDMTEKQAEEDEIQEALDEGDKILDEIQAKLDEQEAEYNELMEEKAEYDQMVLERRLYYFMMKRSARLIQKSWRDYKYRKLQKKLAKRLKKQKKKEAKLKKKKQ